MSEIGFYMDEFAFKKLYIKLYIKHRQLYTIRFLFIVQEDRFVNCKMWKIANFCRLVSFLC